jgi:CBS domain containing-hemolysin-like protein
MFALLATALIVVLISAACSLCEAVLYSVPIPYVESLKAEGSRTGQLLAQLRERVDEPITAILTLNTVANTAGASVAGALAAQSLSERNVVVFSIALTLCILFLSEILPKTIGVLYTRPLSRVIALPLSWLVVLFKPIILVVFTFTRLLTRNRTDEGVSHEEIVGLARLGTRKGTIDADEAAVIQNVLALSETTARSAMTPRPVVFALDAATTLDEALERPELMVHSRIPIYDEDVDVIVGMVFRRDVLAADPEVVSTVGELLRPIPFVVDSDMLDASLEVFLEHRQHMIIVLDEFGGFAGVLTLEDVMEEILGKEIVDEFDEVDDLRGLAIARRNRALARRAQKNAESPGGKQEEPS